jgi:TPP-dependent trihydroxycyclohexane-1,2-dione (THcHDO) dehydratase
MTAWPATRPLIGAQEPIAIAVEPTELLVGHAGTQGAQLVQRQCAVTIGIGHRRRSSATVSRAFAATATHCAQLVATQETVGIGVGRVELISSE